MKIEFLDESGIKHTISLEGDVSRDKMSQIIDYVELMGGASHNNSSKYINQKYSNNKFERIKQMILQDFNNKVFSSKDIQFLYSDTYGEKINLSTVSTYLSRLFDRGFLNRGGSSGDWRYAVAYKKEKICY